MLRFKNTFHPEEVFLLYFYEIPYIAAIEEPLSAGAVGLDLEVDLEPDLGVDLEPEKV